MSITTTTSTIHTRVQTAINTALGPFTWPSSPIVFDNTPEQAFTKVRFPDTAEAACLWALVVTGEAQEGENWGARQRTWEQPIDIYVLTQELNDTDLSSTLIGYADSVIDAFQALGNRWSGVTDMNHCSFPGMQLTHEMEQGWREAGWGSVKISLVLRFDYAQG